MSFSKYIRDENQTSILPEHRRAVQISERDAVRLQIALLKDRDDRRACEARLAYAEEHIPLAESHKKVAEDHYVAKHLEPEKDLVLTPDWHEQSYQQRVEELRAEFAQSPEGLRAAQHVEDRKADLWRMATDRLDKALEDQSRAPLTKDQFMERRMSSDLSRTFRRAMDR